MYQNFRQYRILYFEYKIQKEKFRSREKILVTQRFQDLPDDMISTAGQLKNKLRTRIEIRLHSK